MKIFVVDNVHLLKTEDGNYYAPSIYSYDFLQRYLNAFETVRFIGKVKNVKKQDVINCNIVSGPGVEIIELPWYQGMKGMVKKFPTLYKIYRKSGKGVDCYSFRIAQIESFFVYLLGRKRDQPFVVEVVNDPETFSDLNFLAKRICVLCVKYLCKKANGASYVTKYTLQKKYPNAFMKGDYRCFESYYSSVNIEVSDISKKPLIYAPGNKFRIIHVSNAINGDVKGHYTLINMATILCKKNVDFEIVCVGDGTMVGEFQKYANENHLGNKIIFIGRLNTKDALLNVLRTADLMVLPTKMEGLPRTIIEAMAVGLPCLSTPIAGIPELLEDKYLFDPMDYEGFANEVLYLVNNPLELQQMSMNNLKKAEEFTRPILEKRRTEFYLKLRKYVTKKERRQG